MEYKSIQTLPRSNQEITLDQIETITIRKDTYNKLANLARYHKRTILNEIEYLVNKKCQFRNGNSLKRLSMSNIFVCQFCDDRKFKAFEIYKDHMKLEHGVIVK